MEFFLYHPRSRPTGEVLARALGLEHGVNAPEQRLNALIRWGSERRVPYRPTHPVNRMDAIARATNKLLAMEVMREGGTPVPNFSPNPLVLTPPFLGRDRTHTRGADIVLCLQQVDAERAGKDFYVEYIPTRTEYRVHVFQGRVVRTAEKVLTSPDETRVCWIRNHEQGYTFRRPRNALGSLQEAAAVTAVTSLGLHFGAVDLIVGDDGQTYVLEVNTAPACSPRTGRAYVDAMAEYLRELGVNVSPDYTVLEELRAQDDDGD